MDHVSFALVRLGSNALARGDTGQAEELCRRARGGVAAGPGAAGGSPRGDDDAANNLQARAAAMAAGDRASPDALRRVAVAT